MFELAFRFLLKKRKKTDKHKTTNNSLCCGFLVGIHLICLINKLSDICKLLLKQLSVLLPLAFLDQERHKKPTVISYSMRLEGSGHNIPVLTFKGMLIS